MVGIDREWLDASKAVSPVAFPGIQGLLMVTRSMDFVKAGSYILATKLRAAGSESGTGMLDIDNPRITLKYNP